MQYKAILILIIISLIQTACASLCWTYVQTKVICCFFDILEHQTNNCKIEDNVYCDGLISTYGHDTNESFVESELETLENKTTYCINQREEEGKNEVHQCLETLRVKIHLLNENLDKTFGSIWSNIISVWSTDTPVEGYFMFSILAYIAVIYAFYMINACGFELPDQLFTLKHHASVALLLFFAAAKKCNPIDVLVRYYVFWAMLFGLVWLVNKKYPVSGTQFFWDAFNGVAFGFSFVYCRMISSGEDWFEDYIIISLIIIFSYLSLEIILPPGG